MPPEPQIKRACAFFDGQNLFHGAREAFGYRYPNYDPLLLAGKICNINSWSLIKTFFYTGIPTESVNYFWNRFWTSKLVVLGTRGVETYGRELKYRNRIIKLPDGKKIAAQVGIEKGIDVRIALDVVKLARVNEYDVAIIFSQDQDLSEMADEVKNISIQQSRWIKVVSAFPASPARNDNRGINGTDWFKIDRTLYDSCIDLNDYRPKKR